MSDVVATTLTAAAVPARLLSQVMQWLKDGSDVRLGDWTAREIEVLNTWQLLTAKPVVYLVNLSAKVRLRGIERD